jgi:hypothetical protein
MGIVRTAAGQKKGEEKSPPSLGELRGGLFFSLFLLIGSKTLEKFLVSPAVWDNSE